MTWPALERRAPASKLAVCVSEFFSVYDTQENEKNEEKKWMSEDYCTCAIWGVCKRNDEPYLFWQFAQFVMVLWKMMKWINKMPEECNKRDSPANCSKPHRHACSKCLKCFITKTFESHLIEELTKIYWTMNTYLKLKCFNTAIPISLRGGVSTNC